MKKQKSKKSKELIESETIIADCGDEGLINRNRQAQQDQLLGVSVEYDQDLVDTAMNLDRRQLPDFLNSKVGWNVLIDDKEGNTRVKTLPPMTYDEMKAKIKKEYAGCHIIDCRDLR